MKTSTSRPFILQLLAASALIAFPAALLADRPVYTQFEFGERYDKAARTVVPGFGVFSKTELPPVNVKGWTKEKSKSSAAQAKKQLKEFQPAPGPKSKN